MHLSGLGMSYHFVETSYHFVETSRMLDPVSAYLVLDSIQVLVDQ